MRTPAVLENKDELVLAAIERALPALSLTQTQRFFELAIDAVRPAASSSLDMAPVHANVVQRAVVAIAGKVQSAGRENRVNSASLISPEAIANGRWWIDRDR